MTTAIFKLTCCRRLARIAEKGLYSEAEGLLHEMVEAGLDLGPQAYHGLIFSCVRGMNTPASLDVLRAELDAGADIVCVLVVAFALERLAFRCLFMARSDCLRSQLVRRCGAYG